MSNRYKLQNRTDGVVIRQGQSWITLRPNEMAQLVRDLTERLDDPKRVEEKTTGGGA